MARTNTISHIIYASEWNHVNVAFIAAAEVDGEKFERPTELALDSDAVLKAARDLEKAVARALGSHAPNAKVRTMREVKEERAKALEAAEAAPAVKKAARKKK